MTLTKIVRPVVEPAHITSPYGMRTLYGKQEMHDGIDYITAADPGGDWTGDRTVLAIADGTVVYDQDNYDPELRWTDPAHSAGNMLIIRHNLHGRDYYVRYLHLGSNTVSIGTQVQRGQKIGTYADAGYSFGPHLHLDMYQADWSKVDPTPVLLAGLRASGILPL